MKIIKIKVMLVYIIFLILINHIDVYASNYADEWLAKKQQQQEEYMKELEKDGNLTDEVKESITKSKSNTKNKTKKGNKNYIQKENHGYVYSTDELHVVGLPTDPNTGYTQAGFYGTID